MSKQKFLFVGGSLDGQHIETGGTPKYEAVIMTPFQGKDAPKPEDIIPTHEQIMRQRTRETYIRSSIGYQKGNHTASRFDFYRHELFADLDVMYRLFENYKPLCICDSTL